jgi:ribosomal protein L16 Arg81 hydroxylase
MHTNGTFSRLISPVTLEDFFRVHWEKAPLHVVRETADYYHDTLSLPELDSYLEQGHLSPYFLRVISNGVDCDANQWTRIEQRKNTEPYRVVEVERLFALFNQGATIIINAAQTAIPTLRAFCASLQGDLRIRLQANLYVTPPCSRGFDFHFDPHDVFIMQISGTKKWRLYDYQVKLPVVAGSLDSNDYEQKSPKQIAEMKPGDLLYLPRGTVHLANTSATSSIHITISLMSRYWFSLLEQLAHVAQKEEPFRHALPHGFSSESEKSTAIEEICERLKEFVANTDIRTFFDDCEAEFSAGQNAARTSRFSDLIQLDNLTLDSIVSLRACIGERLTKDGDRLIVKCDAEIITLPHFMAPTLQSLMHDAPFAVRELGGPVSDSGKLELAKRFVQAGLLRIETP